MHALLDERKRLERELAEAKKKLAMGGGGKAPTAPTASATLATSSSWPAPWTASSSKTCAASPTRARSSVGSGVVAIVAVTADGKAGIVVGVTNDLTARFNAVDLVRKGAEALGGKGGGGRPDMAQAGGPDGCKADAALAAIEAALGA